MMKVNVERYQTLVFDCDGVILNSNKVKTQAFFNAALPYGKDAANQLVDYHVKNGGVSRYKKFSYLLDSLVANNTAGPSYEELLSSYAGEVYRGLMECGLTFGLETLRKENAGVRWLIVSGGDQVELREVFKVRGIDHFFDGGIFGSPDTKNDILKRELAVSNIKFPALFIGDSRYDYQAAISAGLDFCFVSKWTEFEEWQSFCERNSVMHKETVFEIFSG